MMLVAGFSGIGKTAVINEVHKPIVRQRGYFIKGKFDQFNRNVPFSAFVQAFRSLMGQLLGESDATLGTWKEKILDAVGTSGQVILEVIPELERIIGSQPTVPELSGSAAQNRFNLLFGKFVRVFTTKEHPLAIFLDDLQWADSASLNLLKLLVGSSESGYLLVLGAYRDNEVFGAHPLMLTTDEISKQGTTFNTLTLAPLGQSDITRLVASSLLCSDEIAAPLSQLVYQKTQGNPFFTTQFLQGLHEEGCIVFDVDSGYWQCDLTQVRSWALTDDVVEFMVGRLRKLPEATQEVLKLAACIGNRFDLETLAVVCDRPQDEVAASLWRALQEGLVVPESETYKFFQGGDREVDRLEDITVDYRFLHDRVQQAAYSLIADNQKQSTHLKIGQLLLAHQSPIDREDNIFNILNHLMLGIDADPSSIPVSQLAELALLSGMKAKLSIAYQAAIDYFQFGISRLPQDSWNSHYRLMVDLNREQGECHYLVGEFEESESLLNYALTKVQKPLDAAQIYDILMTQRMTQGTDILSSVDAGIKGLAVLGMKLPTEGLALESLVKEELQQVQNAFEQMSPQVLLELSPMRDPVQQSCMKLLGTLWSASYVAGNPTLNWLTTLRMMNLSRQHGRAENSSFSYCAYGMGLASQGRYEEAYQFGKVALEVDRTFHNPKFTAKNNNHFANAINPYIRPFKENLPLYQESFDICSEVGDLIFGVWAAAFIIWTHLFKGTPLPDVEDSSQKYLVYVRGVNDQNMLSAFKLKQQFVRELIDETNEDGSLTYQGFINSPLLKRWRNQKYDHGVNWYGFLLLQKLYLQGNYTEALQIPPLLQSTLPANLSFSPIIIYQIYYPLTLTAIYPEVDRQTQEVYWQTIQEKQQLFQAWSQTCPENFKHKYELISAEIARLNGDRLQGIELYDRAIAGAKANEYIQEEALANELAAKFYLDWGKEKIAAVYMQEAYYCYARWGAKAKTDDLEKRYPNLLQPIRQQTLQTLNSLETLTTVTPKISVLSSTGSGSASSAGNEFNKKLDFAAIFKASQSLSGTIQLDELIGQLTKVILQQSGGDRCALMLPNSDGVWQVKAIATPEKTELRSEPLAENCHLPMKLIQYVKNTQEVVAIDDTNTDLPLVDEYLSQQQPKSLLCFPIRDRGRLIGILYLSNQSTRGVFTRDRIVIVNFICTQAAISLENARLYQALEDYSQTLEAKVEERTTALRENEKRLLLAMSAAKQGFFDLNLQTDEAVVSPEYALMLGYDPATFHETVATWRARLHPDDREPTSRAYRAYAAGETSPYRAEFRQLTPQGDWKWILAMGQFIEWDADGRPTRLLGTHTDISDRKFAEIQLQAQNELLAKIARGEPLSEVFNTLIDLVEHSLDGVLCSILLIDKDNRLRLGAAPSLPSDYNQAVDGISIALDTGPCTRAASLNETVIVTDIAESGFSEAYKDLALSHGLRACWSSPIAASDGRVLGTFAMYYRSVRSPLDPELTVIVQMAHIAGIAIERQRAEVAIKRQLAAIEATIDGIAILKDDTYLYVNQAHLDLFGYKHPSDLVGKSWRLLYSPEECSRFERDIFPILGRDRAWQGEAIATRKDGSTFAEGVSLTLAEDGLLICVCRDISVLKQAQAQIVHNALHDPLTDLPNRTLLLERVELAIERSQRLENYRYAVLFMDLDRFKVINDSLGHVVGDQLLVAIAQRLKKYLRKIDLVARLGGDEFVILLEDIGSTEDVVQIAERILTASQTPITIDGHQIFTGISIGIVMGTKDYHQATDLIRDADIAMYRAKTQESNSYKFFDARMHAQALKRLTLETDLRQAIDREEFTLHYQPIVDLLDYRLVGFEALVRWQHPTRGLISPNEFVPVAEETGLIALLDSWVFHQACQQMVSWNHKFALTSPLKISINLSVQDLCKSSLIRDIDEILAKTGLQGDLITLELTESMLIEDIDRTIYLLAQLASKQIQIGIDDFGTGYSSLNYLHRLPVHNLKIDRSFVSQMQVENRNYQVVSTIIALSKQLGLSCVAEGIETQQQLQQLQQLGCQLGQGYLFSKPLAPRDIESHFLGSGSQLFGP